jgi:hypothetical protein
MSAARKPLDTIGGFTTSPTSEILNIQETRLLLYRFFLKNTAIPKS